MKITILLIVSLIFLLSCEDSNEPQASDVKIGVLLPFKGAASSFGPEAKAGLDLAVAQLRNNDKISVELILEDTETDPNITLKKIELLNAQGVKIIIGPYSSACLSAIKGYANENGILVVSPSSVAISLAIPDDNIFRFAPNDKFQAKAINALFQSDTIKAVYAILRNDIWGMDLTSAVYEEFINKSGGQILEFFKYETETKDFSDISNKVNLAVGAGLTQLDSSKIAVYLISYSEGSDILESASSFHNLKTVKWYGSSAFAKNNFLIENLTAASLANSTSFTCPLFAPDANTKSRWEPIQTSIKNKTGHEPSVYALTAYDALIIAARTLSETGNSNDINILKSKIIELSNKSTGITGQLKLDNTGDRSGGDYNFWQVVKKNDTYQWEVTAEYRWETGEVVR